MKNDQKEGLNTMKTGCSVCVPCEDCNAFQYGTCLKQEWHEADMEIMDSDIRIVLFKETQNWRRGRWEGTMVEPRPEGVLTALSISGCLSDIVRGYVNRDLVKNVIAGTKCPNYESWMRVFDIYSQDYWEGEVETQWALWTLQDWIDRGIIDQPRLRGEEAPNIAEGHWMFNGIQLYVISRFGKHHLQGRDDRGILYDFNMENKEMRQFVHCDQGNGCWCDQAQNGDCPAHY